MVGEVMITIPLKEYQSLLENSKWLGCLESAGVDNWAGIELAIELMNEDED